MVVERTHPVRDSDHPIGQCRFRLVVDRVADSQERSDIDCPWHINNVGPAELLGPVAVPASILVAFAMIVRAVETMTRFVPVSMHKHLEEEAKMYTTSVL